MESGEKKMARVKCSFCGKEIECPESMLQSEKHACFECFEKFSDKISDKEIRTGKIHVDIPEEKAAEALPQIFLAPLMEEAFPLLWNQEKKELKSMPRRKLAETMFATGAEIMAKAMLEALKEKALKEEKNAKPRGKR